MPPRREAKSTLLRALNFLVCGAVLLGAPGFTPVERGLGAASVYMGVSDWCSYWQARDRYEEWRRRYRR